VSAGSEDARELRRREKEVVREAKEAVREQEYIEQVHYIYIFALYI